MASTTTAIPPVITNTNTTSVAPTIDGQAPSSWKSRLIHTSRHYLPLAPTTVNEFALRKRRYDFPPKSPHNRLSLISSYLVDLLSLILLGVFGILMTLAADKNRPFRLDDPNLNLPNRPSTISLGVCIVLLLAVPYALLVALQLIFRNLYDFIHACFALGLSLLLALNFTSFMWVTFGGHRPKFISAECSIIKENILPGRVYYLPTEICANYNDGNWNFHTPGFPSGYASMSFASWIFIALYLNAKLNTYDGRSHVWKFVFSWWTLFIPLLIVGAKYRDHTDDFFSLIIGTILGILSAHAAYRLYYCGIYGLDNHAPTYYLWSRDREDQKGATTVVGVPTAAASSGASDIPTMPSSYPPNTEIELRDRGNTSTNYINVASGNPANIV